ncbi:MAG: hypothetical protein WCS77_00025 [Elusimicrobiaceae bacterium]
MTALSENKFDYSRKDGQLVSELINVASVAKIIYRGSLVNRGATYKGVQPAANTTGEQFAGVAHEYKAGAAGSDAIGTEEIQTWKTGIFPYATGGSTSNGPVAVSASDVGCEVYIEDSGTVGKASGNASACYVKCGILTKYVSASEVYVRIDGYAK